jgi:hypothetical protein
MRPARVLAGLWLLALPAAAEVSVRVVPQALGAPKQVELRARLAPLHEVLDRLGRLIGMKVVYQGPLPRQLVTLNLQGHSPAEMVFAVLEGQEINYALLADPTGNGVQTLLVTSVVPAPLASDPDSMHGDETPLDQPATNDPQAATAEALAGAIGDQPMDPPLPGPEPQNTQSQANEAQAAAEAALAGAVGNQPMDPPVPEPEPQDTQSQANDARAAAEAALAGAVGNQPMVLPVPGPEPQDTRSQANDARATAEAARAGIIGSRPVIPPAPQRQPQEPSSPPPGDL